MESRKPTPPLNLAAVFAGIPEHPRILVLDDDQLVLDSITYVLEEHYEVAATRSARAAIDILEAADFHILLTDLMMEEMPGIDLIREVRTRHPGVVVVVVTGYGSKDVAISALKAGAFDFLEKPLAPEIILQAVERAWCARRTELQNENLVAKLREVNTTLEHANRELEVSASFAELSPSPMFRFDKAGEIVWANPATRAMARIWRQGARVWELLSQVTPAMVERCIGLGETISIEARAGEQELLVALKGVQGLELGQAYCYDVSELKQTEAQLLRAQRMEAMGMLAGGVAHDFNNLLTVIGLSLQELLETVAPGTPARSAAETIKAASDRATTLTGQLLAFSRKELITPKVMQLNTVVSDMHRLFIRTVGEDIEFLTLLAPDLWRVNVDRTQMEQVLLNLVMNARDAMPTGGRLIVATENMELDEAAWAKQPGMGREAAPPGKYIALTVSDTGTGITEEALPRIFEPFFTTKPRTKGTGMGLATVYAVVKRAGGHIGVVSKLGAGSTFKVYLPAVGGDGAPVGAGAVVEPMHGKGERVLLAEDQDSVRDIVAHALMRHGYQVILARNGQEALRAYRDLGAKVDLLITDVVMPVMSGKELADELTRLQPGLRVIYMTGYPDERISRLGVLEGDVNVLQKPFDRFALLNKVREVIDAKA